MATGWDWGYVTLTFVPAIAGGYKPAECNKSTAIGTITPVALCVVPEPLTLALLALGGLGFVRRR